MAAVSTRRPAVLIVEDEFIVAMHMSMLIKQLGYDIAGIAVDTESALALAERNPDIVLVDCKLRDGLTGPSIGHHLATARNATVIYVTANPQYVADEKLVHPAILGVYPKPVNDNEISEILDYAVKVREGVNGGQCPPALRKLSS
jgi:two-component system, response regulator PdtaR